MVVVADTSPLRYLILIEHVHVLPALYGDVIVPPAVVRELTADRTPQEVRTWLANKPEWLRVQAPREVLAQLGAVIDDGEREAERLHDVDANIHRVVLENELKAEYQEFLQERNRNRDDSDGRPDRDPLEIQNWAREHNLPCDDQGTCSSPTSGSSTTSTDATTRSTSR